MNVDLCARLLRYPESVKPSQGASAVLVLFLSFVVAGDARAYVNQSDGTVVPVTARLQMCLDRPGTGETTPGAVDAIANAATIPEAYRPVLDATSGHYRVTFVDIGEGAGFRNSLGWYWVGTDVSNTANLHTIFGCRTYAQCDCPCATTRTVTIDFDTQAGFSAGRPIGLWLRTPERLDATREAGAFNATAPYCTPSVGCDPTGVNFDDSCGGRLDSNNRIYFTSSALNDDGDFVHFLVYQSATRANAYYFGFEDLFRGGDNDYEDMLVRSAGLVPTCVPRPETCNNLDDDCDGVIDDGVDLPCSSACGAGMRICAAGVYLTCNARTPTAETCNGINDDCDGNVDEGITRACSNSCGAGTEFCTAGTFAGCTARTPTLESCNGLDDDCDTRTDESLTMACATVCGAGTRTCTAGAFGACSAAMPTTETCNGLDDDCDARLDEGLVRDCSNACGSGIEICRSGVYGDCTAPTSGIEACNNLDDDCDGLVDEGIVQGCSTACGVGVEHCTMGAFVGCDAPLPSVETCNNLDDDCDGVIDDGNPGGGGACLPLDDGGFIPGGDGGVSSTDGGTCGGGSVRCIAGALTCQGASSTSRETCNCRDDDCDGRIDEAVEGDLCPGGACIASECTCREPCVGTEFPCPLGTTCDTSLADPSMDIPGYCVEGPCSGVVCMSDEEVCNAATGVCENLCSGVSCRTGFVCVRGGCVEDNCFGRGCPHVGDLCLDSGSGMPTCTPDACASVTCGAEEFCRRGACEAVCSTACASGESCVDGACVTDGCGGCASGLTCVSGTCTPDTCTPSCGRGRVCRGGTCISDPCAGVRCPGAYTCDDGACVPSGRPAGEPGRVLASGGGGCVCSAAGSRTGASGTGAMLFFFALGALVVTRRRRTSARALCSSIAAGSIALCALLAGGCEVDPYCYANCGDTVLDGGSLDGAHDSGDASRASTDGCVPTGGEETCNSADDDCDGLVDEGFDLQGDPRNCGGCDAVCNVPNAFPACHAGECAIERCAIGHHDLDGVVSNGCELACLPTGDEICDEVDDDCDGRVDEGFDLTSDVGNCGRCGNVCSLPNATATCSGSACRFAACRPGYVDADGMPDDGCEYRCTPSGAETCNGVDDNCNHAIDEGFDTTSDPGNCGTCGTVCAFAHAVPHCATGTCTFNRLTDCVPGFSDADGDPRTGCEYMCIPSGGIDDCDGIDDDCDGRVDESDPMAGTACGLSVGACMAGMRVCVVGALTCLGGRGALSELCNGADDDCDGRTDETPLPGVGDTCGATDVGRCSYGATVCTAGVVSCAGTVGPITEICNGIDDNCNGATDDGIATPSAASVPSCAETRGVCVGRVPTCRGATGFQCDLPATYQPTETICDGLDNDCDGTADENCLNPVGADVRIDTGDTATAANSLRPYVVGDPGGSRVWIGWNDLRAGVAHTYFNRSVDTGATFVDTMQLDTAGGATFAPRVILSNTDDLVAVWPDFRGGTSYREIYSRFSTDYGVTLAAASVKVNSSGTSATRDSYNVEIAASGANVYATWEGFVSDRSRHIFFARSTNGGSTWAAPIQLSTPATATFVAATPRIAAAGANVYVVWRDNRSGSLDIELRRSTDSGATFVAGETRIDTGTTAGSSSSFAPDVATEGTNVYVAWVDDRAAGSFDIWLNRSTNSGASWLAGAVSLDADAFAHDSIEPHVVAPAAGAVLVSWLDYRAGFPDPLVTRSTTSGASFGGPVRLDTSTAVGASGSYDLAFAAQGSLIAAVWADDRNGLLDIYLNYSLDGGANFQPNDYRLDTSAAGTSDSQRPSVFVGTGVIHTAWEDHRRGAGCPTGVPADTSCSNGDIYYRRVR